MICQTIKNGIECGFMTKKGCGFNGGACNVIIDKCEGCGKVIECPTGKYCRVYPDPAGKWRTGKCPTATHLKIDIKETTNPDRSAFQMRRTRFREPGTSRVILGLDDEGVDSR